MVRNNVGRQAVKLPDVVQIHARNVLGAGGLVTGNEVAHFGEAVHRYQDGIKAF